MEESTKANVETRYVEAIRLTASRKIARIVIGSALTGVLFTMTAPITIVPGAIHWRWFAFLPCLIGILYGPVTGFFAGYFGNLIWSLTGYFNLATPFTDCGAVGLTGLIPGLLVKPHELKTIKGVVKATVVSVVSGFIMVPIVAAGMDLVGAAPFWVLFWFLIGSDIPPIALTGIIARYFYSPEKHTARF